MLKETAVECTHALITCTNHNQLLVTSGPIIATGSIYALKTSKNRALYTHGLREYTYIRGHINRSTTPDPTPHMGARQTFEKREGLGFPKKINQLLGCRKLKPCQQNGDPRPDRPTPLCLNAAVHKSHTYPSINHQKRWRITPSSCTLKPPSGHATQHDTCHAPTITPVGEITSLLHISMKV